MEDLPLSVEPVVGFRTWLLTEDRCLQSVVKGHVWRGEPAKCVEPYRKLPPDPHLTPHEDCQCGYWLLDSYERVQQHRLGCMLMMVRNVRGIALGWGRTVVCENGWRVERAAPAALLDWPERRSNVLQPFTELSDEAEHWNQVCEEAAEAAGLPLLDVEDLMAYADELRV